MAPYLSLLAETQYCGIRHRLACWLQAPDAQLRQAKLERAERRARAVVVSSPKHRKALDELIKLSSTSERDRTFLRNLP